jgi:hypothetical protein
VLLVALVAGSMLDRKFRIFRSDLDVVALGTAVRAAAIVLLAVRLVAQLAVDRAMQVGCSHNIRHGRAEIFGLGSCNAHTG